ncbi:hypothetical protein ICN49_10945 [Polynucleobacter sp. MWH-Mekk-B1]|uniref:hypothetical protein n=1 Tax=Polynucleobacter finlandensis TaxID=1855894 RepID=UPI001C0DDB58|nr:hypothetical protein [Polynucleobacter finlandensis]MBU3545437.1 hypothetical protein [Polynucleobacter finlandensis]
MRATHLSVLGMRSLSMVSILLVTAGCAPMNQQWYPSEDEGASVRAAIRSQSVYPDGRPPSSVKPGMDGVAAKSSVDNYQKSFVLPTLPPLPVGTGGSSSGGSTGSTGSSGTTSGGTTGF